MAESPGESLDLRHFLTPPNAAVAPAETSPDREAARHGLGAAFYREDELDRPRTGDATALGLHEFIDVCQSWPENG